MAKYTFGKEATKDIVKVVSDDKRKRRGEKPGKKFEYLSTGGGGGSALFKMTDTLPKRTGDELGSAMLVKMKIEDGKLVEGEETKVYNATSTDVEFHQVPDEFDDNEEYCNTTVTENVLYVIASLISGHWLAHTPLYALEELEVGTSIGLDDYALTMGKVKILAHSSLCEPDEIEASPCQE